MSALLVLLCTRTEPGLLNVDVVEEDLLQLLRVFCDNNGLGNTSGEYIRPLPGRG